jgi:hypothetical protein
MILSTMMTQPLPVECCWESMAYRSWYLYTKKPMTKYARPGSRTCQDDFRTEYTMQMRKIKIVCGRKKP